MSHLDPIYTADNCRFRADIRWGVTLFWRVAPAVDLPITTLAECLEPDGIQLQSHREVRPAVTQFALTALPHVAPPTIVARVKGRLQYLLRDVCPKAFQRNFTLRSFGHIRRQVAEDYVASQLDHHVMAAEHIQQRFHQYQIEQPNVDLAQPQYSAHGVYWYTLHLVLVHQQRWNIVDEVVLKRVHDMILSVCRARRFRLSRGGILADHLHLTMGCPFEQSPVEVALCFLNNLAFAHGMKTVFQYGAYIGTFGEYDVRSVKGVTL